MARTGHHPPRLSARPLGRPLLYLRPPPSPHLQHYVKRTLLPCKLTWRHLTGAHSYHALATDRLALSQSGSGCLHADVTAVVAKQWPVMRHSHGQSTATVLPPKQTSASQSRVCLNPCSRLEMASANGHVVSVPRQEDSTGHTTRSVGPEEVVVHSDHSDPSGKEEPSGPPPSPCALFCSRVLLLLTLIICLCVSFMLGFLSAQTLHPIRSADCDTSHPSPNVTTLLPSTPESLPKRATNLTAPVFAPSPHRSNRSTPDSLSASTSPWESTTTTESTPVEVSTGNGSITLPSALGDPNESTSTTELYWPSPSDTPAQVTPEETTLASSEEATERATSMPPSQHWQGNRTGARANGPDPGLHLSTVAPSASERSTRPNWSANQSSSASESDTALVHSVGVSLDPHTPSLHSRPEGESPGDIAPVTVVSLHPNTSSGSLTQVAPESAFCLESEFRCPKGSDSCVSNDKICDGVVDCPEDRFDELECRSTGCGDNFLCTPPDQAADNRSEAQCIARAHYCDGLWDCPGGSDELGCSLARCRPNEFKCVDGSGCLTGKQVCDGLYDCRDHSDEIGCVGRSSCESSNRFYCDIGLCIAKWLRCDGRDDCPDGTDERDCAERDSCWEGDGKYLCQSGECIDSRRRCDGQVHCHDHSDEHGCHETDSDGLLYARNGLTGHWSLYCARPHFGPREAQLLCAALGQDRLANFSLVPVSHLVANSTWALEDPSNGSIVHSALCPSNLAVSLWCDSSLESPPNNANNNSGGLETPGEVPSALYLTWHNSTHSGPECPAYALTAWWVVTSGQCASQLNSPGRPLRVHSPNDPSHLPVGEVRLHPKYSVFRTIRFADYDLALVSLTTPLPPSLLASSSISLAPTRLDPKITCFLGSVGDTAFEVVPSALCNSTAHLAGSLTPRFVCAVRTPSVFPSCVPPYLPLICLSSQSRWYLSGFVSYQRGCDPHFATHTPHPTVFSNLFEMSPFIQQTIGWGTYRKHRPSIEANSTLADGTEVSSALRAAFVRLEHGPGRLDSLSLATDAPGTPAGHSPLSTVESGPVPSDTHSSLNDATLASAILSSGGHDVTESPSVLSTPLASEAVSPSDPLLETSTSNESEL